MEIRYHMHSTAEITAKRNPHILWMLELPSHRIAAIVYKINVLCSSINKWWGSKYEKGKIKRFEKRNRIPISECSFKIKNSWLDLIAGETKLMRHSTEN